MAYPVSTSIHLFFGESMTLNEQIEKHIQGGFKFLDFNFLDWQNVPDSPFLSDEWESWILSAKETAEKHGVRFNQAHAPVPCLRFATDYEGLINAQKRAIKACDMLGIRQMVYHALPNPAAYGIKSDWLEANRKYFSELIDDARKYNVGICIENVWPVCKLSGDYNWNTDTLLELVDSFDHDIVGVCWDTGHGNLTGNGHNYQREKCPELLPYSDQYQNITKIGKRLRALHINDNSGLDDDHIMPYTGSINWDDVIRALDDIGYAYSFTFEAHRACVNMPLACRDAGVKLLHDVGVYLVSKSKNGKTFEN